MAGERPRVWRVALILLVGAGVLGGVWYQNRWGVAAPMDDRGALDVHAFGEGSTAVVLLHGYAS